ncbi:MAG TPA: hypothetical protein VFT80_05220 [Actinomycetota bacterium]|nr:hypothetical protein [Actinomycetota bacterium]
MFALIVAPSFSIVEPSVGTRVLRVGDGEHHRRMTCGTCRPDGDACYAPSAMSEHTERLEDLAERLAHAKEFL